MRVALLQRPVDPARSELMRRVRQRDTKPEGEVAHALRQLGIHYRRNVRSLPGSPDFANKSRKWAVFVHGCFWHHHSGCKRATIPTRNREFWTEKFASNRARDRAKERSLKAMAFEVIVIWECESSNRAMASRRLQTLGSLLG